MARPLVSVEGASKKFCGDLKRSLRYAVIDTARELFLRRSANDGLRRDEFWALRDVSFEIHRGESLGVMGVNGAGKSTLLKLVLGTLRLTEGRIETRGRVAALTEHGLGFHSVLTGRENAYLSAAVLGIERRRVDEAFDRIVAFAGLEKFIDSPLLFYSSGMQARLGFAGAMHLEPDVLLVDEVLAVGDIGFQRRCIEHARRYLVNGGSLLLVSHNPLLVQSICDRCLVLEPGHVAFDGDSVAGVARFLEIVGTSADDPVALDAALDDSKRPAGADPLEPTAEIPADDADAPVVIEDFGIEPLGAGPLRTGDPARVFVRYRATRDLRVHWGFCLLTEDLATTIGCEGQLEPLALPAGCGELSGTVPRLPLAGGRYALRVTIADPVSDLPLALRGSRQSPRRFTVEMAASRRDNFRRFTRDLVHLQDLTWERRAVEPRPSSGRSAGAGSPTKGAAEMDSATER